MFANTSKREQLMKATMAAIQKKQSQSELSVSSNSNFLSRYQVEEECSEKAASQADIKLPNASPNRTSSPSKSPSRPSLNPSSRNLLMNMVIHDLRSPASQIQHSAEAAMEALQKFEETMQQLRSYFEDEDEIHDCIRLAQDIAEGLECKHEGLSSSSSMEKPAPISAGGHQVGIHAPIETQTDLEQLEHKIKKCLSYFKNEEEWKIAQDLLQLVRTKNKVRSIDGRSTPGFQRGLGSAVLSHSRQVRRASSNRFPQFELLKSIHSVKSTTRTEEANANLSLSSDRDSRSEPKNVNQLFRLCGTPQPKLLREVSQRNSDKTVSQGLSSGKFQTGANGLPRYGFTSLGNSVQSMELAKQNSTLGRLKRQLTNLEIKWDNLRALKEEALSCLFESRDEAHKMNSSSRYCSSQLLNLINDLLDLAKAQNGSFKIMNQEFSLSKAIKEGVSTLQFLAKEKKVKIVTQIAPSVALDLSRIFGDEGRIKQVLINLISNALKFTDKGGQVTVSVQPEASAIEDTSMLPIQAAKSIDSSYNLKKVTVSIKDTGQGISKEGLSSLFSAFSSLDEHRARNTRGTGLGLSICKLLVEKLGGKIDVTSKKQEGSTFTVTLPLVCLASRAEEFASEEAHSVSSDDSSSLDPHEVSQSNSLSLHSGSLSNRLGYHRLSGKNPNSSRKQSKRGGIEVTPQRMSFRRTKDSEEEKKSGRGLSSQRGVKWGRHQVKLENQRQSFARGQTLAEERAGQQKQRQRLLSAPKTSFKKTHTFSKKIGSLVAEWSHLKVLLVNDEPISLMFIEQIFSSKLGVNEIETAANGRIAVSKATSETFDLIMMDLNMPVMGGMEATRLIRQLKKKTTIVALSATSYTEELEEECREAGFDKWLTQPLDVETLISEVMKRL